MPLRNGAMKYGLICSTGGEIENNKNGSKIYIQEGLKWSRK